MARPKALAHWWSHLFRLGFPCSFQLSVDLGSWWMIYCKIAYKLKEKMFCRCGSFQALHPFVTQPFPLCIEQELIRLHCRGKKLMAIIYIGCIWFVKGAALLYLGF